METETSSTGDKTCLNCGSDLSGRFCPACGQDSREIKKSVWHFALQFFETFTDLDNRLWATLFPLLLKPGYLSQSYLEGKRKRYLNPIQMYAFFSFIFFLSLYYLPSGEKEENTGEKIINEAKLGKNQTEKDSYPVGEDNVNFSFGNDTVSVTTKDGSVEIGGLYYRYETYDSIQNTLPQQSRHGWMTRKMVRQFLFLVKEAREDGKSMFSNLMDSFRDHMPTVMTLLLPLFALILQLLYLRRGLYFVEHLVVGLHLHSAAFFYLTVSELISAVFAGFEWHEILFFFGIPVYIFLAMKRFYQQGFLKTLTKLFLLGTGYGTILLLGTLFNLLISAFFLD